MYIYVISDLEWRGKLGDLQFLGWKLSSQSIKMSFLFLHLGLCPDYPLSLFRCEIILTICQVITPSCSPSRYLSPPLSLMLSLSLSLLSLYLSPIALPLSDFPLLKVFSPPLSHSSDLSFPLNVSRSNLFKCLFIYPAGETFNVPLLAMGSGHPAPPWPHTVPTVCVFMC